MGVLDGLLGKGEEAAAVPGLPFNISTSLRPVRLNARKERIILKSEVSSPIDPKPGCRFAPRCVHAQPECQVSDPALREVSPGRFAACRLAEQFI